MTCASCGRTNRGESRFCVGCGSALVPRCAACGREGEPDARFCGGCGAALGAAPPAAAPATRSPQPATHTSEAAVARKIVTIVFADLVGSTALHERLDAESARALMDRYYATLHAVVDGHGGTVVKLLGDGVMAAFGVPRVAEDDAIRAVRAAVAMQQAFRRLADEPAAALGTMGLRVAVNTGEVVVSGEHDDVVGDPVNVAARLQQEAQDGDVLIGEATRRLVSDLVTLELFGALALKGRAETVAAYRVVSLERPAGAPALAFVGREDELRRLTAVYDVAITGRAAQLAVILGSPGLGKSRLVGEFVRRLGDGATVMSADCDATGGATFAPLADGLRGFLRLDAGAVGDPVRTAIEDRMGADAPDRPRIASGVAALLAGTPAAPEETFFVIRRFLAALAAAQPVVLVIDDLQWAESLLLDLVEHLVQWGTDVPLLLLVAARPELRDARSSLAVPGGVVTDVVTLAGLDAGAATRLAANAIGGDELPAAVAGRVLAISEGNPLFVGELVRMLVQDGALKREGERWTMAVELSTLAMPPTIHALLAARIERLRPEERAVLERAAVVGRQFSRAAIAHLLPREVTDLDARLEALRRSELIERDTGWLLGEPVLRFHHVLIRDAAYRRLLKGTRAELHARLADWIEARVGDAPEHDEMIGWHLEQAHQLLRELGPLDAAAVVLGERAARRLAAAGRRALARDDVSLAASLLGRAFDRLAADAPERADLVLDWCEALLSAGDVGPAAAAIDELDRVAADSDRLRAWHTCFAGQLTVLTAPQSLQATADRVGAAARDLAAQGDAAGEAKAHFVHAQALGRLGKIGACEAALDQALAAARRAGDRRRANAVLAGAPLAALWGPSPVTRASGRCLDVVRVLRITQGAPAVEAVALSCQGVLEALRGRTEAARRMLASSRTMVEELGISHRLYETDVFAGRIDLLEGDAPAAERALRAGYDGLRDLGLGIDAARAAALLGRALLAQDRAAEAETLSHESEQLAGDDLQAAIAWRGVRAEALARRGDHAAAIALAEAAVAIAAATDALLDHADARLALAAALRAGGRRDEADAEERRAFELWEAKGATVLAERARRDAADGVHAAPAPETRPEPRRRRVRPNAATALSARMEAAVRARDLGAIDALYGDDLEAVDHPNATTCAREGELESSKRMIRLPRFEFRLEPLATLGESLSLSRRVVTGSGRPGAVFDVAEYEMEHITITEVDQRGRLGYSEMFSPNHLGAAIARLYERYAEKLPEGPERERATVSARAVAFMLMPGDPPDLMQLYAPTYEDIDHRSVGYGAVSLDEATNKLRQSFRDLVDGLRYCVDDVLALDPNGFVRKTTATGVWREGGGSFERTVCTLSVFGPDGRVTRHETFDADREAEALSRFETLTGTSAPPPAAQTPRPARTRVRPNAATEAGERFAAAIANRDLEAFERLFSDSFELMHHPTGASYGRRGMVATFRSLFGAKSFTRRQETLATLGDSLVLLRHKLSFEGLPEEHVASFGPVEMEEIAVTEIDEHGRFRRLDLFDADHLGGALTRLYERYAELLPDGVARVRAMATARSIAVMTTFASSADIERLPLALSPALEFSDRRRIVGVDAGGADDLVKSVRTYFDLGSEIVFHYDDVLCVEPNALLMQATVSGRDRRSDGFFEIRILILWVFGPDGLIVRWEGFDLDCEAEALARFDALTGTSVPLRGLESGRRTQRCVRPNAVTRVSAEFEAICAARDLAALVTFFTDDVECIDHPTGVTYGAEALGTGIRRLLQSPDARLRFVPLATLGDSWGLVRREMSAGGAVGGRFDVGAYEIVDVAIYGTDERGRLRHCEIFAAERLRAAIVRLYERYAESVPEGPVRTRASGCARTLALFDGVLDADRIARGHPPSIECVDHRILGTWSAHGLEEWSTHWREQADLAADFTGRDDDVLALEPAAILVRETFFGTSRMGGGYFENVVLTLMVFDADGRNTRCELFEPDQEAEALARFDALTQGAAPDLPVRRRVRPNAATRTFAALEAAFARRDLAAVDALLGDPLETIEHPTGTTYGRDGQLESSRRMMRMPDLDFRIEPLATLGDALCLARRVVSASGTAGGRFDVGEYEIESIVVNEVDAAGRLASSAEVFASDHLCQAIARLYARYAERLPDGPARERATAMVRLVNAVLGPISRDRIGEVLGQDLDFADHRRLGLPSSYGRDGYLQSLGALFEATDDLSNRLDDVLALGPDAFVFRLTNCGTDRNSGGAFERPLLFLATCGADRLAAHWEFFDVDREAEALARFDALVGTDAEEAAKRRTLGFANAAIRAWDERLFVLWRARDWPRFTQHFAVGFRYVDRRRMVQLELDRDRLLEFTRQLGDMRSAHLETEVLATRGDRLALLRFRIEVADREIGPSELEHLNLLEMNESGEVATWVRFDAADLDAAYAELDARFAAGEGAAQTRLLAVLREAAQSHHAHVGNNFAGSYHPEVVVHDHRVLGWGIIRGLADFTRIQRSLVDLAPDTRLRIHHVRLADRGYTWRGALYGTRDGGAFETPLLAVCEVDARGVVNRFDLYDPEQMDEARARFAELAAPAPTAEPFANAASATVAPVIAAIIAHDWPRFAQLFADDFRMSDRRRVVQLELDRDQYIVFTREVADGRTIRATSELLATRGERLALTRPVYEFADADVGPSEIAFLILTEVDVRGRIVTHVRWDVDDLDAAYAELDARFAADEAAGRAGVTRLQAYLRAVNNRDWATVAALYPPTFVEQDHRPIAVLGTTYGGDAWTKTRTLVELAPDTVVRFDHMRLARRGVLSHATWRGSRDGARYEIPFVTVTEMDAEDLPQRNDLYEPEQMEQARARFAELASPAPSAEPFANAATRALRAFEGCWRARDWNGVRATYHPTHRMDDRRRLMRLVVAGDDFFANERMLFDDTASEWQGELLATRGERLALFRVRFTATVGSSGPMEVEALDLVEVDAAGLRTALVVFDPDALDAAYAELDARYEAGEGAAYAAHHVLNRTFTRAIATRDWGPVVARCAPTFVEYDHRPLAVLGTTRGGDAWALNFSTLVDLAPDTVLYFDHLRFAARGYLFQVTWRGSREGGAYEIPLAGVIEVDEHGRFARVDIYDPEQIDAAWARFAEMAKPVSAADRFANAATRALGRGTAALGARDWQGFAALFAAEFRIDDRTSFAQLEAGAAEWLAAFRQIVEMTSGTPTPQVLATRGDRLVLGRVLWRGAAGDVGPSEVERLLIIEVDDRGDHLAVVSFNPSDLDAAYAELDARWQAGEATAHPRVAAYQGAFDRGVVHRDWDALAALHDSTLVARDHRLVGWDVLRGPVAYVGALRAMVDLAPDALGRLDHVRASERGLLAEVVWVGTRDGGAFESPFLWVVELDAEGLAQRLDFYDPHHLEAARARFDEIKSIAPPPASAVRDPLAAITTSNWAAATMERWQAAFAAGLQADDWNAIRGLCAPGMVFEDRQRQALVSGDAELMIASARERARTGARPEAQLVGTAGDRVVIVRMLWSGGPPGGRFEIEYFSVIEVDEAGLLSAIIFFDLDDPRAAVQEAWARWATIDPAAAPWVDLVGAIRDSYNANDWERLRALFADDVVIEDHRRTGFGRMEGVDVYLESVKVLWGLVSDQRVEMGWFWPAVERHGVVIAAGRFGTLKDGGAFESEFLSLWVVAGGRITWFEMFEVEDLDKALARLAELRPDPLRIPPNAATRAYDRWYERAKAGDWDAHQALFDERFRYDDRRRVMRLTGDRDMGIASDRYTWELGARPTRTLLSTAGDRMVLQRMLWRLGEGGQVSEVEFIELNEVDTDGRFIAALLFDLDDRAAASAELFERYAASRDHGLAPVAFDDVRAWNAHDLERLRALLPPDFYLDDRRRTGVGRLDGVDAYLASLAAVWELSRDLRIETLYIIAIEPHGTLYVCRWFGTNAEGGEFDAVYVCLGLSRGDRPVGLEIFELDDLDIAQVRFEALRPA